MKALLVVDMQNITVGKNHAKIFKYDNDKLIASVNDVISSYQPKYVFYIVNVTEKTFVNRFSPAKAYEGTQAAQLVDGLNIAINQVYKKYKGDAFSNPHLNNKLLELLVNEVEIVGVDGGGCVALTALGAVREGYSVAINERAVGTTFINQALKYKSKLLEANVQFI